MFFIFKNLNVYLDINISLRALRANLLKLNRLTIDRCNLNQLIYSRFRRPIRMTKFQFQHSIQIQKH